MSDPIAFPSATPAIGLPLLVAGQAQKEFFVNQALCILDALYVRAVKASQSAPPATAIAGDCFRVTSPASQAWAGREDHIAVLIGGAWHFIGAREGMHMFDQTAGHTLVFGTQWERARAPTLPTGGTVVDSQARTAIQSLIQSLQAIGILGAD
jgi:hypothetical protein